MNVLEIGTGTGFNAAFLTRRAGTDRVHSIEIDPQLAARARENLADAEIRNVDVVVGDGVLGLSDYAPYDRIVVTGGSPDVAKAWVAQLRDDGVLIMNLTGPLVGGIARLYRTAAGLVGSFVSAENVLCTPLQGMPLHNETEGARQGESTRRPMQVDPSLKRELGRDSAAFLFFLQLAQPTIRMTRTFPDFDPLFSDLERGEWVRVAGVSRNDSTVTLSGSHPLWDDVSRAYGEWRQLGSPDPRGFALQADGVVTTLTLPGGWLRQWSGPGASRHRANSTALLLRE